MDNGAWTDLITNATMLTAEERDDPRPWLGELPGGSHDVAAYVHESTHHWCFNSRVGNALFTVAARADSNAQVYLLRRAASTWRDYSPELDAVGEALSDLVEERGGLGRNGRRLTAEDRVDAPWLILDDVLRFQVTIRLLRPLAEGLALFAEHDAVPRVNSRAGSHLAKDLAFYFKGGANLVKNDLIIEPFSTLAAAGGILRDARLSPYGLASKASLLAAPLSTSAQGYLPGYLAVKSMWWHLSSQDSRLATETDLVLAYLRSYFYDDPGLATVLLASPERDPLVSVDRVVDHLARRLADIERVTANDVALFEDSLVRFTQTGEPGTGDGILADPRCRERATPLFMETVQSLGEGPRQELLGERVVQATQDLLFRVWRRRPYLSVSSVPVTLRVRGDGAGAEVEWRGKPLFAVAASDLTPHAAAGSYDARLEILLATAMTGKDLLCRGAFVTAQGRLLSCTMNRQASADLRRTMLTHHQERNELVAAGGQLSGFANGVVAHMDGLKQFLDRTMRQTIPVADSLFRDTALWPSRDQASTEHCGELMSEDGLIPVLGSARLLNSLALLGLATGIDPDRSRVAEVFASRGFDLEWTLDQLDACWHTHGYPPRVTRSPELLLSLV
ncbi:hypothetical protein AB5J55_42015 [Streptomyces sp. R11]|uniref:Uncharacterized protein n=1 Tax=Streptomyces sp. R11 TaxID=3238625 RepID=A0AB39NBS3_9ACTN